MALGGNGNDDVGEAVDPGHEPRRDDRGRVVLVYDRRPLEHVAALQRGPGVEASRDLLERAAPAEPCLALLAERGPPRPRPPRRLRRPQLRLQPDAADAQVRDLDVRLLETARVLALVDVVEVAAQLPHPRVVDRVGAAVDPQLVALSEVAAVGYALDQHVALADAVGGELVARLLLERRERLLEDGGVELRH